MRGPYKVSVGTGPVSGVGAWAPSLRHVGYKWVPRSSTQTPCILVVGKRRRSSSQDRPPVHGHQPRGFTSITRSVDHGGWSLSLRK